MSTPGFAIVTAEEQPLQLAMQRLQLTGKVLPLGARLWVRHDFESSEAKPIEVVYAFPLPREATLRRFRISGDGFSVNSELRPTAEAVKTYETAVQEGSLAGLARVYRDGIVNLNVGNIRPREHVTVLLELLCGVEVHDDGLRLRFPFTLAPSYHAQARTFEMSPDIGEIELPEEDFGNVILPQYHKSGEGLHEVGFALELEMSGISEIASPSHALRIENSEAGSRISLARASDLPNRDLVLDVKQKSPSTAIFSGIDEKGNGRIAALVPSAEFGKLSDAPRRIVIVVDRSGSMQGTPIAQAKRAIDACLAVLNEGDSFALIAFDDQTESFREHLTHATSDARRSASEFLAKINARGGTHLASALETAAQILQGQSGDILVFTDGQVFATDVVLDRVRATHARVHALGIGSASQDRFLAQLASHTGGISRFMTPNERVDMAALELFAAIGRPVASDVQVTINGTDCPRVLPEPPREVYSGTPFSFFAVTSGPNTAELSLTWQSDGQQRTYGASLPMEPSKMALTLKLLHGARIIADLESRDPEPFAQSAAQRREASRAKEQLRAVSEEYGLASREMALVAVVKRTGDLAGDIPKTKIVPVGMPEAVAMNAYFGRSAVQPMVASGMASTGTALFHTARLAPRTFSTGMTAAFDESAAPNDDDYATLFSVEPTLAISPEDGSKRQAIKDKLRQALHDNSPAPADAEEHVDDVLIAIAGMLEPDGGLPGQTAYERLLNTFFAVVFFASQGHRTAGPFREHVIKMRAYLWANLAQAPPDQATLVREAFAHSTRETVAGDWVPFAKRLLSHTQIDEAAFWKELQTRLSTHQPSQ